MFLFIIRNTRLHTHSHSHMIRTHRHAHSFTQLINIQIFNSAHKDRHTQSRNRTSTQVNYHMHTHAHHCLFIKGQRYIIVSFPSLYQANKTISFHPSAPELLPSCRLRNVSLKTTSPGFFFQRVRSLIVRVKSVPEKGRLLGRPVRCWRDWEGERDLEDVSGEDSTRWWNSR